MSYFEQGKTAYFAGISRSSNPHKDMTAQLQWFEGYDYAKKSMEF